jgi:hypothetical protein
MPVTALRYEDMLERPAQQFQKAVQALHLDFDAARLDQAVEFSKFDNAKEQERQSGFREKHMRADARFFREGRAGGWREELDPHLADRIIATHGAMMRRFGYLNDRGGPTF